MNENKKKLQWKTVHTTDFNNENDFLETILLDDGVEEENMKAFLHPTRKYINDPLLMNNMAEAVSLVHKHLKNNSKIFVRVDADVDGFTSSATLIQFLQTVNPNITIDYVLNYEKRHGLTYEDLANHRKDEYGLIIIPDASMTVKDARMIKNNFTADILVLDHHLVENEFLEKATNKWINREEAKQIYKQDKEKIEVDCYTNYCLAVNCTDGKYPNSTLSGAGVVQKFIEAYVDTYLDEDELEEDIKNNWLDLVSLGIKRICANISFPFLLNGVI